MDESSSSESITPNSRILNITRQQSAQGVRWSFSLGFFNIDTLSKDSRKSVIDGGSPLKLTTPYHIKSRKESDQNSSRDSMIEKYFTTGHRHDMKKKKKAEMQRGLTLNKIPSSKFSWR